MDKIIEMMLSERLISEDALVTLIQGRATKKVSLVHLINENLIDVAILKNFLVKKIQQGRFTLKQVEALEGINAIPIFKEVAKLLKIEYIDLDNVEIDMRLFSKAPYKQLIKYNILPIEENSLDVVVVFADPLDMIARDASQRIFPNKPIKVAITQPHLITNYLLKLEMNENIKELIADIRKDLTQGAFIDDKEESPAVLKLIEIVLRSSIDAGASDIHLEVTEKSCVIRERVDGLLRQSFIFDKDIFNPFASRMKLLANLDIAEKRKPQDGRFSAKIVDKAYDFRVSTLPTMYGESIVLRILDKTKTMIKLEEAGMSTLCYDKFLTSIQVPYGIVLVTGPTGSGKTTTLYAALNAIKDVKDKIITVEDPVEYQINGLQQVQVRPQIGLTFDTVLKSILRQDPDKIMVGEIRDKETLRIAIQAALTGHLVLSTLHTNDAISAITRILDMGIEEYLVSGSLIAIQAQRLVRKICVHCKVEITLEKKLIDDIKQYLPKQPTFYKGKGCKVCSQTGYSGREMISEVLVVSEKISRIIARGATKEALTKQAFEEGFVTMFEDGISKVLEGKTTIEEIYRVARL